jgi:type II secretion system (T2SS) protein E
MSTPLRERPDAPLGTLIFRAGLLPAETIENALEEGVKTGRRLGEILIERGLIKEEDLTRLLAGQKGLPFVSLREEAVEPDAARLLAEEQARLYTALPIRFEDGMAVVAVADPTNDVLNRNIREALGQEARFVVAARSELNEVIGEIFSGAFEATEAAALSEPAPEPEPQPLRVDTSLPGPESAQPEPNPEPEPQPAAESEPEPAQPEPEFDASAYEFDAPAAEPRVEPEPEPEPTPEPEPAPEAAPTADPEPTAEPAFEAPAPEPAPAAASEPPVEPEPLVAPLATEPVAPQSLPQSNGQVPEHLEDDTPPPAAPDGAGGAYRVSIRLTSGERMTVAECDEIGEAKGYAKALTKQLSATDSDDWPFINGRFLKPDTIVSVDVEGL